MITHLSVLSGLFREGFEAIEKMCEQACTHEQANAYCTDYCVAKESQNWPEQLRMVRRWMILFEHDFSTIGDFVYYIRTLRSLFL